MSSEAKSNTNVRKVVRNKCFKNTNSECCKNNLLTEIGYVIFSFLNSDEQCL